MTALRPSIMLSTKVFDHRQSVGAHHITAVGSQRPLHISAARPAVENDVCRETNGGCGDPSKRYAIPKVTSKAWRFGCYGRTGAGATPGDDRARNAGGGLHFRRREQRSSRIWCSAVPRHHCGVLVENLQRFVARPGRQQERKLSEPQFLASAPIFGVCRGAELE